MGKITLIELAPYLPYGLGIDLSYYDDIKAKIAYVDDNMNAFVRLKGEYVGAYAMPLIHEYDMHKCKPFVRPLSQLTQEIEHNGERFIPIVELYKIACGNYKDAVVEYVVILSTTEIRHAMKGFSDFYFGMYQSENDVRLGMQYHFKLWSTDLEGRHTTIHTVLCQSLLFQKLYEWHFDIHNWLGRGLAISIENL